VFLPAGRLLLEQERAELVAIAAIAEAFFHGESKTPWRAQWCL
jgi:hypothetical protein